MELLSAAAVGEPEVVRQVLIMVQEVLLDDIAPISQTQNKISMAEMSVVLHQVPENRAVPDGNHRLRHALGALAQPRSHTTAEQNNPHTRIHHPRQSPTCAASDALWETVARFMAAIQYGTQPWGECTTSDSDRAGLRRQ